MQDQTDIKKSRHKKQQQRYKFSLHFFIIHLISTGIHLLALISTGTHLLALKHTTHWTPRSIEGYTYEVHLTFHKETKSFFCYASTSSCSHMEQCNTISGHSTALLVSQSMDFHPNPGLTAIHIIRLYSLTMQAIQEHKTSTISYPLWTSYFQLQLLYFLSNAHLLTLLINIFFEAGDHFSGKLHFRWWTWHPLPFTPLSTHLNIGTELWTLISAVECDILSLTVWENLRKCERHADAPT